MKNFDTCDIRSKFEYRWDQGYYISYKGITIEHYDEIESEQSLKALEELHNRCINLERLGLPVNGTTVIWCSSWFMNMTAFEGSIYLEIMGYTPSLYQRGDDSVIVKSGKLVDDKDLIITFIGGEMTVYESLEQFAQAMDAELNELGSIYHTMRSVGFNIAECGQNKQLGNCYAGGANIHAWLKRRVSDPVMVCNLIADHVVTLEQARAALAKTA